MHSLGGEEPVVDVRCAGAAHGLVPCTRHDHREALLPQQGHGVELDRQGLVRLVDGLAVLVLAHPAGIEATVTGIEEDREVAVARRGRVGHAGTGLEAAGIDRMGPS